MLKSEVDGGCDAHNSVSFLDLADSRDRRDRAATLARRLAAGVGSRVAISRGIAGQSGISSTGAPNWICSGTARALLRMHSGYNRADGRTKCFKTCASALRMLLKHKSFTAVAILSLALGIGANTAIFQLIDAMRLRTLPVKAPQELAEVRLVGYERGDGGLSPARRTPRSPIQFGSRSGSGNKPFPASSPGAQTASTSLRAGRRAPARMLYVSGDFFNTLGVKAALGRVFTTTDDQRGCGAPGLVISHDFWQREYGGDANVIGRKLTLGRSSIRNHRRHARQLLRHGGWAVFRPGAAALRQRAGARQ